MFIGSSREALGTADTAGKLLNDVVIPEIWDVAPFFQPMHGTFESLFSAAKIYDFGLFIMSADDTVESRGQKQASTRDNVLFELGLFLGAIGTDRVFSVIVDSHQDVKKVKIPSDLLGLNISRFIKEEMPFSLRIALRPIKDMIVAKGPRQQHVTFRSGWAYDHDDRRFSITLDPIKIEANKLWLESYDLVLVTRRDSETPLEIDTAIQKGSRWQMSMYHQRGGRVSAMTDQLGELQPNDVILGHLLLVPKSLNFEHHDCVKYMLNAGCRLTADSVGRRVGSDVKVG